jgi:hypothetical protein
VFRKGAACFCKIAKGSKEAAVAWADQEEMSPFGLKVLQYEGQ